MHHLQSWFAFSRTNWEKTNQRCFTGIIKTKNKKPNQKDAQRNRTSNLRQRKRDFLFSNCGKMMHLQLVCVFSYELRKNKPASYMRHSTKTQNQKRTHKGIEPQICAIKREILSLNCGKMMHLNTAGLRFLAHIEKKQTSHGLFMDHPNKTPKPKRRTKESNLILAPKKKETFLLLLITQMMRPLNSWFAVSCDKKKQQTILPKRTPQAQHQKQKSKPNRRTKGIQPHI